MIAIDPRADAIRIAADLETRLPTGADAGDTFAMIIEIYGDLVCPWCLIGRIRLARALEARRRSPAPIVRRRSFQLNPDIPPGGIDRLDYMSARLGGRDRALTMDRVVTETAKAEGLALRLDRVHVLPNTRDAHRLVRLAERRDLDDAVANALARAFFLDGADIGDHAALADIVAPLGFDRTETASFLAGTEEIAAVRASDHRARRVGLQAIPSIIVNGRYVVAGAQDSECLAPLLVIDDV